VLGISESEYLTRFTTPAQTDWVMRCTPRKVLRAAAAAWAAKAVEAKARREPGSDPTADRRAAGDLTALREPLGGALLRCAGWRG
jgi:hypothetical protein